MPPGFDLEQDHRQHGLQVGQRFEHARQGVWDRWQQGAHEGEERDTVFKVGSRLGSALGGSTSIGGLAYWLGTALARQALQRQAAVSKRHSGSALQGSSARHLARLAHKATT